MGDKIGVLNHGRIVQVGTPHEIYNNPRDTFVAALRRLAADEPARCAGRSGPRPSCTTVRWPSTSTPATRETLAPLLPADGRVRLGIRPEDIALVADEGIAGSIYGAENHGAEIIAVIEAGGHRLRATVPAKTPTALNQPVRIAFAQPRLHFFDPLSGRNLRPL